MATAEKTCCNCHCHQVQVPVTLRQSFFQDPIFSRSWDDFEQMRRDMITESRKAWQKFDEEFKRLESKSLINIDDTSKVGQHEEDKKDEDSKASLVSPMKLVRFPSLLGDDKKHEDNVIKVKDDEKQFEVTMDTSQYKPDELKVNVTQNTLTVEAKHTEQSDDGRSFVSKQFLRRYTLPRDCKYDLVSSNLSADGILVISAPKMTVSSAAQDSGRNVPILRA